MANEELIQEWIEEFKNSGLSVEEELKEVRDTISNERIWMLGSVDRMEEEMHEDNIDNLTAYAEYLEEQLSK